LIYVPETLVAIPFYEPVTMGFPMYIWIIIGLVVAIIFMLLAFKTEVYDRMQPVWGFRAASSGNKPLAIVNGMSGKIWMETVENIGNIFESMNLPLKWILTVPSQGQFGKANTIYLCDDLNTTINLDIDYALVAAAEAWNEIEALKPEAEQEILYDWNTFEKPLMDGRLDALFPDGIKLPPIRVINFNDIRRLHPKWMPAHHSGYINAKIAERTEGEEKDGKTFLKFVVIGGIFLIICCAFSYLILSMIK
jgi:hypothetical protein